CGPLSPGARAGVDAVTRPRRVVRTRAGVQPRRIDAPNPYVDRLEHLPRVPVRRASPVRDGAPGPPTRSLVRRSRASASWLDAGRCVVGIGVVAGVDSPAR